MTKPKPAADRKREKPDVFIPLFIDKFLGDTMHCSTLERGAYMMLLFHHWKVQGPISSDEATLATVAGVTPQQWRAMRAKILAFFTPGPDPGTIMQKRAMAEMEIASGNKDRGRAGAEARWGTKSDAVASNSHANSGANGMQNACTLPLPLPQDQNSLSENSVRAREEFRQISGAYPSRRGDPLDAAEAEWVAMCERGSAPVLGVLLEAVGQYAAHLKKSPGEPVVFLRKFLTERWRAWLPERPKSAPEAVHTEDWGDRVSDAVASFKHALHPQIWANFFAKAHWDADARQLQFATRFEVELVATRYGEALIAAFGEPFAIRHMPVRRVA